MTPEITGWLRSVSFVFSIHLLQAVTWQRMTTLIFATNALLIFCFRSSESCFHVQQSGGNRKNMKKTCTISLSIFQIFFKHWHKNVRQFEGRGWDLFEFEIQRCTGACKSFPDFFRAQRLIFIPTCFPARGLSDKPKFQF